VKRRRAADAVGFVEREGVELHDACVALERAEGDLAFDREVEEPSRSRRAHTDPRLGTLRQNRVDDLDAAGRMTEPVA
jgi:hypothetical protein